MRLKTNAKLRMLSCVTLLIVGFVIILAEFVITLVITQRLINYAIQRIPKQNVTAPFVINNTDLSEPEKVTFGLPVRLRIPKINADALIEHIGLTSQGAMGVPNDPVNVGWYNLGPHPGEMGSAVVTGHFDDIYGGPGVFANLTGLKEGDKLEIEDDNGSIISFVVRESRSYDQDANTSEVFNSNDEKSHLNLITCEGAWNKASKSYSKRLVVFTDKD